jgi:hypothetical protein
MCRAYLRWASRIMFFFLSQMHQRARRMRQRRACVSNRGCLGGSGTSSARPSCFSTYAWAVFSNFEIVVYEETFSYLSKKNVCYQNVDCSIPIAAGSIRTVLDFFTTCT